MATMLRLFIGDVDVTQSLLMGQVRITLSSSTAVTTPCIGCDDPAPLAFGQWYCRACKRRIRGDEDRATRWARRYQQRARLAARRDQKRAQARARRQGQR